MKKFRLLPENESDQTTSADYGWTTKRESAEVHSISVAEGQPGCKYQLSVSAVNSGGTSVPSECIYVSIPPRVPAPPPAFHVLPQGNFPVIYYYTLPPLL